jgi:SAM-dependent methyltransferase
VTNEFPELPRIRGTFLARRQWKLARKWREDRVVVDIGCGTGQFLMLATKSTPPGMATGVDIDSASMAVAQQAGLSVSNSVSAVDSPTLYTMWHSAEHFQVSELKKLLEMISTNKANRLVIAIPNSNSRALRRHGELAAFSDPDHHHTQMSERSLGFLLNATGWRVVANERLWVYGVFSSIQTTINLSMPKNLLYNSLRRNKTTPSPTALLQALLALITKMPELVRLLRAEFSSQKRSCLIIVAAPTDGSK